MRPYAVALLSRTCAWWRRGCLVGSDAFPESNRFPGAQPLVILAHLNHSNCVFEFPAMHYFTGRALGKLQMAPESLYAPLKGDRDIRLLELSPADGNAPVECRLRLSSLDSREPYYALSYVWGDASLTTPISCNGAELQVTVNLGPALRRLRRCRSNPFRHSTFWIDAICINQHDLDERARQVHHMRDIYHSAFGVFIYLGEDAPGLDIAMSLIDELYRIGRDTPPFEWPRIGLKASDLHSACLPCSDHEAWHRFNDFFSRPWFSRVWVLQEAIVAATDPIVLCGPYQLPLSHVMLVCRVMGASKLQPVMPFANLRGSVRTVHTLKDGFQKLPLLVMLQIAKGFYATDPRDMIYALVGLATAQPPLLEVSYRKSVKDVFREFAIADMRQYGDLTILSEALGPGTSSIPDLPSCVPDWSVAPEHGRRSFSFRLDEDLVDCDICYDASKSFKANIWQPSGNPDVLHLKGVFLDEINWVMGFDPGKDFETLAQFRRPGRLQKLWNTVSAQLGHRYIDGNSVVEAFWMTLAAREGVVPHHQTPVNYLNFLHFWQEEKVLDQNAAHWILAQEYSIIMEHATREPDVDERRRLTRQAIDCRVTYLEEYRSLLGSLRGDLSGLECTTAPDCRHCAILSSLEQFIKGPPVAGPHPGLALQYSDPIMADYFHRLKTYPLNKEFWSADSESYRIQIRQTLSNRSIFLTKGGRLGVGPKQAQQGDKIALLVGARVPFVLRQPRAVPRDLGDDACQGDGNLPAKEDQISAWALVGECYIHGIMAGEALPEGFDWATDACVLVLI